MRFPHTACLLINSPRGWQNKVVLVALVLTCPGLCILSSCRTQTVEDCLSQSAARRELKLNTKIQQHLSGGEKQCYQVALASRQFAHLTVNQLGIDVVITTFDPNSRQIARIDRPNGSRGREGVSLVASLSGNYIVQIQSLETTANDADYNLSVDETKPVLETDRDRALAEQTVSDAEDKRASGVAANLPLAISKFEESLRLWRDRKDRYEECVALYGLALTHQSADENQEAIVRFEESRSIAHELGDLYMEGVALKDAGWSLIHMGDTHDALARFSAAKELLHSVGDRRGEGICLYGIGWAHVLEGEDEKALEKFKQSLDIRRATNDARGEAITLIGIGKVLNHINRNDEALKALDDALRFLGKPKGERADALSALGWVCSSQSRPEEARNYFAQALEIWTKVGDRTGEATTLYGLARIESQRGDLLIAKEHMRRALDVVEAMRAKGSNERLRTSYFALVQDYFDFDIDLLMRLDQLNPGQGYAAAAFEVSERSRNRKLLDLLNEARGDIRLGIDPSLLELEKSLSPGLKTASNAQRSQIAQTDAEKTAAAKEVDDLTARLEEVEARIRQVSPQYALLAAARTITAADVQKQLLDGNTMLLEYALGRENSYLWAITRDEIESFELPSGAQINEMARGLYELLTARDGDVDGETAAQKRERVVHADAAYPVAALNLSRILLGPVADKLGSKRLIVVTQSALGVVPFSALPSPGSVDAPPSQPLLLNHEIINVPSASCLAEFRRWQRQSTHPSRAIAVIADPVFQRDDERFGMTTKVNQESDRSKSFDASATASASDNPTQAHPDNLPRLFSTRWEAREISALVPDSQRSVALDFAANQRFVTSPDIVQHRVLHFATHTVIDDQHPELSRIALSSFDPDGNPIDGFLHAHEIYRLRLPVELVVLSSCSTAKGSEVKGEGLIAFAHAFMCAGSRRVMAALWNVDDTPTSEFMVRYYRKLLGRDHLTPPAALRATQMEFLQDKRWQSPYFWAPFVIEGEWRGW
jgi:CHAT domain-containing protein/tetratricopeptide (TPR) repeat protein